MKHKYLFIVLLFFSCWSQILNAQTLRLINRNPIPRENQEIELEYFYTNSKLKNRFEAYIENAEAKTLINGTFKINDPTNKKSEIVVGPIEIKYEGKVIKSDSIKIRVFKKLRDISHGIWINQVKIDGSDFIVIEQRIPSMNESEEFASFNENSFLKFNVEPFEFATETYSFQANENKKEKNEYSERRTVLLIRNTENLKTDLKIDDSFFKNVPANHENINLIIMKE